MSTWLPGFVDIAYSRQNGICLSVNGVRDMVFTYWYYREKRTLHLNSSHMSRLFVCRFVFAIHLFLIRHFFPWRVLFIFSFRVYSCIWNEDVPLWHEPFFEVLDNRQRLVRHFKYPLQCHSAIWPFIRSEKQISSTYTSK